MNPVELHSSAASYSVSSAEEDISGRQGVFLGQKAKVTRGSANQGLDAEFGELLHPGDSSKLANVRKAETQSQARQRQRRAYAQAEEFLPDFAQVANSAGFQRLMAQLRRSKTKENHEEIREALEGGALGDPATKHAAVVTAIKWLDGQGGNQGDNRGDNSSLRQFLQDYLQELVEKHEPEIRAGYNVSRAAASSQDGKTERVGDLRKFYCDAIFDYKSPVETYRFIMESFPDEGVQTQDRPVKTEAPGIDGEAGQMRLEKAISFLFASLASELDSNRPSLEPSKLKSIMDGMYMVEFLRNTYRSYFQMLTKLNHDYGHQIPIAPGRLMDETLGRIHKDLINDDEFLKVAEQFSVPPLEPSIHFLTRMLETARSFPAKLFDNPEDRAKLMTAIQLSLDSAIARESEAAA